MRQFYLRIKLFLFGGFLFPALLSINCTGPQKETPHIKLADGLTLPLITALCWLDSEEYPGGDYFASVTEDSILTIWNIFSGLVSVSAGNGPAFAGTDNPAISPDRTKSIFPSGDGGICLADAASGKEIARY